MQGDLRDGAKPTMVSEVRFPGLIVSEREKERGGGGREHCRIKKDIEPYLV